MRQLSFEGKLNRRALGITLVSAASAIAVPMLLAAPRPIVWRGTIALTAATSLASLPLTMAYQLGFFQDEGLAVSLSEFDDEASAVAAVTAGTAQLLSGDYSEAIKLQAKGRAYTAFVMQGRTPQVALGISTRNLPDTRWALALRGLRVGIPALGSPAYLLASRVLARAGMKEGEMNYIEVGNPASTLSALRSGQIDAVAYGEPLMTQLEQKGDIKIVSDSRTLKGSLEIFDGPMPGQCLFAHGDFLSQNAQAAQALSNAMVRALKWLRTAGPGDILRAVPESHLMGDRALYLAAFTKVRESISLDGLLPEEAARTALKALAAFDASIQPTQFKLSRSYTNEFASKAKLRYLA